MNYGEIRFLVRRLLRDELHQQWPDNNRIDKEMAAATRSVAREYCVLAEIPYGFGSVNVVFTNTFSAATAVDSNRLITTYRLLKVSPVPRQPAIRVPLDRLSLYDSDQTDRGDWIIAMRSDRTTGKIFLHKPTSIGGTITFQWEYALDPTDFTADSDIPQWPDYTHELIGARAAMQLAINGHPAYDAIRHYNNDLHRRFVSMSRAANAGIDIHTPEIETPVPANL